MARNKKAYEIAVMLTAQDKMSRAITGAVNKSARQLRSLEYRTERFGQSAMTAGLAAGAALAYPAKQAAEFETLMSNVSTLVDTNIESIGKMGAQVLQIAERVPKPVNDVATALYDVRSAGVVAGEAMNVLEQSGRLAVAGLSTTNEAVNIMTSAYNAFREEGLSAHQIADLIFKTVKAGKTTVSELSQAFGANAGIVQTAGIRLADFQAATAALTQSGRPAAQAQNQIKAAVIALQKPTADLQKIFEGLNVETGKELIERSGSVGKAFINISNAADAMGINIATAVGRAEALAAVQDLSGSANAAYVSTLRDMVNGTAAVDEAFKKQMRTAQNQTQILKNQMTAMSVAIGSVLNPILIDYLEKDIKPIVAATRDWIQANPEATAQIVKLAAGFAAFSVVAGALSFGLSKIFALLGSLVRMAGVVGRASMFIVRGFSQGAAVLARTGSVVKGLTAGMRALKLAFLANPIGLAIGAGIALGVIFDQLWRKSEVFRGAMLGLWEVIKGVGRIMKTFVMDRARGMIEGISGIGKAISLILKGEFSQAARAGVKAVGDITGINAARNAGQNARGLKDDWMFGMRLGRAQVQTSRQVEAQQSAAATPKGAAQGLQMPGSDGRQEINYSPSIEINGPVSEAQRSEFTEQLRRHKNEIIRIIKDAQVNHNRVSYGG